MWEFIKSAPWTFAIGGAILLAAIVGVIVGVVTKGRWADKGFMVREGKTLKWAKTALPLSVWLHPELPAAYRAALVKVREALTQAVGREVFMIPIDAPAMFDFTKLLDGHVGVVPMAAEEFEDRLHASTDLRFDTRDGRLMSALCSMPWPVDEGKVEAITLHEAGHVLGLDHDEQVGSVMHPQLQSRPQLLTDNDRKLLRGAYGA